MNKSQSALSSLAEYSEFVSQLLNRANVIRSTLVIWSNSPYTGTAEGEVFFTGNIRLRMREELDFDAALISYFKENMI